MASIADQVRLSMFARLNVAGITDYAAQGVHFQLAPAGTKPAYVIFHRQSPKPVTYGFSGQGQPNVVIEEDLWFVKAVTDADSAKAQGMSPTELGRVIADTAESLLTASLLTLSTATNLWCMKHSDIPEYIERDINVAVHYTGFLLRVKCRP